MSVDNLYKAAAQFTPHENIAEIREYGNGNINSTFLVTLESRRVKNFILQRINPAVFQQPQLIMTNMRIVTEHINSRLNAKSLSEKHRWKMPQVLMTSDEKDHWIDQNSSFWRAISYIDNARSFDTINNADLAKEAGYALGMFHSLLSDLPEFRLTDTIKGFHVTPLYLMHYDEVLNLSQVKKTHEVDYCIKFIEERRSLAPVLENAREKRGLCNRTIHGDPKINNILIDNDSGHAVSIVDLDTVKPGLVHYDIGDCLRSGCNALGEETLEWESVEFQTDLCKSMLSGYYSIARGFLTASDHDYIYDSVRLLAFELGLRFFTDYLEGNIYFKTSHAEHNLQRSLVQFKLTESIESQMADINAIIKGLR